MGALLPTPGLQTADTDPDQTLDQARTAWLPPEVLDGLVDRWLTLAAHEPKAADAVAQFARTTSLHWQLGTGLNWLERIIDDQYDLFANHLWFVTRWLSELRESASFNSERLPQWHRLVDGLTSAGDTRAADLQRLDE